MLFQVSPSQIVAVLLAAKAMAAVLPSPALVQRTTAVCYSGESKKLLCYRRPQGTPQNVNVDDVLWAAQALREYGTGVQEMLDANGNPVLDKNGVSMEETVYRFLNMTTTTAPNCGEWTIFDDARTVLVTAKLLNPRKNGLVWIGDIADTIDGGLNATEAQKTDSIIPCGKDGGSREVRVNMTHSAYTKYKAQYDSGEYAAADIVIKVVQNIDWKNANPGS